MPAEQSPRLVVDPGVHFGKPCVAGTRIPVRDVLELVQEGLSFDSITTEYYPVSTASPSLAADWSHLLQPVL